MNRLPPIKNPNDLKTMFKQIQEEHKELKFFVYGTYADLIAASRSDMKYPCLMLETPNDVYNDNGADYILRGFESAFIVLLTQDRDDNRQELEAKAGEIAEDILARLHMESIEYMDFHYRIDGARAELIDPMTQDNDVGYRVEFKIQRVGGVEHNPEKWN